MHYPSPPTNSKPGIFEEICSQYENPHFPTPKNPAGSLNEPFWAALYRSEHDILFEPNESEFYEFGGDIYRPLTEHTILHRVAERLRQIAEQSDYPHLAELTGRRHISGVIAHLKGQTEKADAFAVGRNFIHVTNGVLKLNDDGSVTQHDFSPNYISRNLIPIEYQPEATCADFEQKLLENLNQEDRLLIKKFMGQCLTGYNIAQILLILHGIGNTGKSTFAEVLQRLIGEINCAELRTNLLAERFEIGRYLNKTLLIGADVPRSFLNGPSSHRIKALTGGDLLEVERKSANSQFQIRGLFNILVTSNTRLTVRRCAGACS
jgi:putative DNA primase/helicase